MPDYKKDINIFLTRIFNHILSYEQRCLNEPKSNLTINDFHTIEQIGLDGNKKMTDIADAMGVTLATMTSAADRLEKKGCIRRERSMSDRRIVLLSLTRFGRVMCKLHDRFHERMVNKATENLTAEEMETLFHALSKLNDFFEGANNKI
ncbi:MAG: Multiple antibiotic resistance protein MarR [Firmicutes bacterium ADurb.Bin193]|nr:MAG: Multiple antibiotic resistance protein MarR [Firmicutes bacterium ADurb.Bin193]